jgi:hypothetical protein
MAHRKETTVEHIYREVTGNTMPAAVKRILLPKRKVKRHSMVSPVEELRTPTDTWIRTLAEGRRVKFTNQELPNQWTFITAQVEGNKVAYSTVLTNEKSRLGVRKLKVISPTSFERSSNPARTPEGSSIPTCAPETFDNRRAQA